MTPPEPEGPIQDSTNLTKEVHQQVFLSSPTPTLIFVKSTGRIVGANTATTRVLGYDPAALIGKKALTLSLFNDSPEQADLLAELRTSGSVQNRELTCLTTTGEIIHLLVNISQCTVEGTTYFILTASEITEQLENRRTLRANEKQLLRFLNAVPFGILVVDAQRKPIMANRAARAMLGKGSAQDVAGETLNEIYAVCMAESVEDYPVERTPLVRALKGEPCTVDDIVINRVDRIVPLEVTATPVYDEAGRITHAIGVFQDISERKESAEKLAVTNEQLIETARLAGKAEIVTGVLHNVGNVVNSIGVIATVVKNRIRHSRIRSVSRTADLLREHSDDLAQFFSANEQGKKIPAFLSKLSIQLVQEQEEQLHEMEELIQHIQHITEIVNIQQSMATAAGLSEMVSIDNIIDAAIQMDEPSLHKYGISLTVECPQIPPAIFDRHRIVQIMINLIKNAKNALLATGKSNKQIKVTVSKIDDENIRIQVEDNGIGIEEDHLERVFNHGFTTKKDGHGFGLHSAQIAAHEMGGSIAVHSDGKGEGAVFTLNLPLKRPNLAVSIEPPNIPNTRSAEPG